MDILMRSSPADIERVFSDDAAAVSEHPMSIARVSEEKAAVKGGYKAMEITFANGVSTVGRDLGGIPKKVASLAHGQCHGLCQQRLAEHPTLASLHGKLALALRKVVKRHDGPKHIPAVQPLMAFAVVTATATVWKYYQMTVAAGGNDPHMVFISAKLTVPGPNPESVIGARVALDHVDYIPMEDEPLNAYKAEAALHMDAAAWRFINQDEIKRELLFPNPHGPWTPIVELDA